MPAYRAQRQSLSTVGGPQAPQGPQIDIPGAIDALTGGATSLIHATMIRKQNERAAQDAQEEKLYRRSRDKADDERRDRDEAFKREQADREFMLQGGVPARTTMDPTATTASVAAPVSPIKRAMTPPPASNGLPAPTMIPQGAPEGPATMPLPASTLTETHRPATVDPTKSRAYIQATDVAEIRGKVQAENAAERAKAAAKLQEDRLKAAAEAAVIAQKGRIELERIRQAGKGSKIRGGMTANQLASTAAATADGLITRFNGDRQAAYEWLNSDDPEAKGLRDFQSDLPVSWGTYLDNARAKFVQGATRQSLSFQQGPMGDTPDKSVKRVNETRRIVAGTPAAPAATPTLPKGAEAMAPMDAASPFRTSPARIGAVPTAPAAPVDTVPDADISDTELDAALAALPDTATDSDVKAWVLAQRKKKPSTKK